MNQNNSVRPTLIVVFSAASIFAACVLAFYIFIHGYNLSSNHTRWAEFGDFIGGLLNPIFGFFGLFALLYTISLQSKELELTRKELQSQNSTMEKQNFESTFFQLLRVHNEIVNGIDLVKESRITTGRDCFPVFLSRLKSEFRPSDRLSMDKNIDNAYERFYTKNQSEIGHYFRYLYNMIKFVDNSNISDKRFYTNIIRAQLSNDEMALLFYNCISSKGKMKFKPYVIEYSLLKNMPFSLLFDQGHKELYPDTTFK